MQPDTVTGDIVFVLQQKEHPRFRRKGDDLFVEHTLSLAEALCGFQHVLTHLDGRQLLIKSNPGEVIKPGKRPPSSPPLNRRRSLQQFASLGLCLVLTRSAAGQFKAINEEGMPLHQRPFMRGRLYIHFTVDFPDFLTSEQSKAFEAILPHPRSSSALLSDMDLDECEETTLHNVNIEEEMRRKQEQQAQEAYEEDDGGSGGGAQRVQCAQQ